MDGKDAWQNGMWLRQLDRMECGQNGLAEWYMVRMAWQNTQYGVRIAKRNDTYT